jgi:hypothetical protein
MSNSTAVDALIPIRKAARLRGACETTLRIEAGRGELVLVKLGTRTFVRASDLQQHIDRLVATARAPEPPASLQGEEAEAKRRAYWERRRRESAARNAKQQRRHGREARASA